MAHVLLTCRRNFVLDQHTECSGHDLELYRWPCPAFAVQLDGHWPTFRIDFYHTGTAHMDIRALEMCPAINRIEGYHRFQPRNALEEYHVEESIIVGGIGRNVHTMPKVLPVGNHDCVGLAFVPV